MKQVVFILLSALSLSSYSQDINFSQFYELPLLRNPALAGIFKGDIRITSAYRNQWSSVTVPYKTEALGVEIKRAVSEYDYLVLGMQLTNDVAGDSKMGRTQFLPVIAFNKSLSKESSTYITLGFSGGAVQQRFDPTDLKFDDQFVNGSYSASNPTQQTFHLTSRLFWDANVGISLSSSLGNTAFYLGGAYFHLTNPAVAFNPDNEIRLNRKIMINGGISIPYNQLDKLIGYADFFQQGGSRQGQGGLMCKHDFAGTEYQGETIGFSGGCFYRWNDAVIPVIKFDYYKLGVGLSYDINISKLRTASQLRGAFELTMVYRGYFNNINSSVEKVQCPKFY